MRERIGLLLGSKIHNAHATIREEPEYEEFLPLYNRFSRQ